MHTGTLWRGRRANALLIVGGVLACAVGIASARQQPRHPLQLTGEDWRQLSPKEKEVYLSGFVAGAAAEQVRAVAMRDGTTADSSAVSSRAIETLRSHAALHYRFAPSVYAAQLDDYYWWTDRRVVPILDVMITINKAMLQQQFDGNP